MCLVNLGWVFLANNLYKKEKKSLLTTVLKYLGIDYYFSIFNLCNLSFLSFFRDAAQQKCYCGSSKCRGFISKTSKIGDQSSSNESSSDESSSDESSSDESSSDESSSDEHVDETIKVKSDACLEKKRKTNKKITNKDKQRLRQVHL